MQAHQVRVTEESSDLVAKIERLEAFIGSPTYHGMDRHAQYLLRRQLLCMREYADILSERIALFATPGAASG